MRITREGYILYFDEPCTGSEENILLMQAGGLTESHEKLLLAHLETCEACKSLFLEYELIDEAIRDSAASLQIKPPKKMPKKLRVMLSEASKQHLATHLQELGQAILFQKTEVCDLIRPWSKPQPLDRCVYMLDNSFTSVLNDPLMQEVGLKPEFVEDCRQFLHGLVDQPNRLMNVESAKEALDRSLAVEPDRVLTVKSLYDYYLSKYDSSSEIEECKRLLKCKLNSHQKSLTYIHLSSSFTANNEYHKAAEYLNKAESYISNFILYFEKFKFHFLKLKYNVPGSQIEPVFDNLVKMDSSAEAGEINTESITLASKWFHRSMSEIYKNTNNHQGVRSVIQKYLKNILD